MNRRVWVLLPLLVFAAIAIFFAVGLTKDPRRLDSILINQPIPDFDLPPIKGRAQGLASADLKGQVSLVNIFGSWCVACQVEHPFLMKIKETKLAPLHGIDWREESPDAGPNWLKRHGDPYTLIGDDPRSKAAIAFGVTGQFCTQVACLQWLQSTGITICTAFGKRPSVFMTKSAQL